MKYPYPHVSSTTMPRLDSPSAVTLKRLHDRQAEHPIDFFASYLLQYHAEHDSHAKGCECSFCAKYGRYAAAWHWLARQAGRMA